MEMGSNKCTLRKEIKNEIAKYIDNEFMNETMKEIVNYIKTTSKVVIDDSNYDESDIDSRVELKDNGAFNIHDYMYVKDFLYELSWEGSYVEVLEEDEDTIDTFIEAKNYSFPVACDTKSNISNLYPSAGIPYTVIVGKDGLVTETFLGAKDADSQYTKLRRALQEAYEAN